MNNLVLDNDNYIVKSIQNSIHYNPAINKYIENIEMHLVIQGNHKLDYCDNLEELCRVANIDISRFTQWELIRGESFNKPNEVTLISGYIYI